MLADPEGKVLIASPDRIELADPEGNECILTTTPRRWSSPKPAGSSTANGWPPRRWGDDGLHLGV